MINLEMMNLYLPRYLEDFPRYWPQERDKWEAVRQFQAHWDLEAENFREMFERATAGAGSLLNSSHAFPRAMILDFAEANEEKTRQLFRELFDEGVNLSDRVQRFQKQAEKLRLQYGAGAWKNHFQNTNAISTYLWLRYPEKYYIYQYTVAADVAEVLCKELKPKRNGSAESMLLSFRLYDEIREVLAEDDEFCETLSEAAAEIGVQDDAFHTATIDFCHYLSAYFLPEQKVIDWFPQGYHPGISAEQWQELLQDRTVFSESSLQIMKRFLDFGGEATCKQLSEHYGESCNFYNSGSSALARRVAEKSHCPVLLTDTDNAKWWPILYVGRYADQKGEGVYIWKLRPELAAALEETDLSEIPLYTARKEEKKVYPAYTEEDFLSRVYLRKERLETLMHLLRSKKNIILQGAPGVGKTFIARKLAYVMMGEAAEDRVELIQFHQNYSYEDFIMGYRPEGAGFQLHYGVFYQFCKKAAADPEHDYFFLIDEINRGNLSKIMGELMMLLEKDYRGTSLTLAYTGEAFTVPENLYLIGMMNTADRSLAMIDYALRRRFSFFEMEPAFLSDGFRAYQKSLHSEALDELLEQVKKLNQEIREDPSLGKGFCIGHSYFCGREEEKVTEEWLRAIVEFDLIPLLEEYWFDEPEKLQKWETNLRGVFHDN